MGGLPGNVREVPVMYRRCSNGRVGTVVKRRKGCRMSCDVDEAAEGLENVL